MYKYLFGPVPSRRLGMSLGVDLVPHKVCSLDCVYCECGASTKLTSERKEYVLYDKVVAELSHFFDNNPDPDYITFSGAGEPTLNSRLGDVLNYIKTIKPNIPVAVLTNATLLHKEDVRNELLKADLILPSLDAASGEVFAKINKPEASLKIETYIQGLVDFSKVYSGQIWLEVMILPGYNDSESELQKLLGAIIKINPDKIQINTLDRPGTDSGLYPATREQLEEIKALWEEMLRSSTTQPVRTHGRASQQYQSTTIPIEIISSVQARQDMKSFRSDIETAILETISRRPCTVEDMAEILGNQIVEINKYLSILESANLIERKTQERGVFYQIKR